MRAFLLFLIGCFLTTPCFSQQLPVSYQNDYAWYHGFPSKVSFTEKETIPREQIHKVKDAMYPKAVTQLEKSAVVLLTPAQASELAGEKLTAIPSRQFYLVRGVGYNPATGGFEVHQKRGDLYVSHYCLGAEMVPKVKIPVIVELVQKPKMIYMSCGMAR